MKVDRSRTMVWSAPAASPAPPCCPEDYGQQCFASATVRGACSDWRARPANCVSHSQISHWGETNVDTMPLALKLNSLTNEIRERLGRSPAQKPVNGSRMEHNCTAHDRRVAQE